MKMITSAENARRRRSLKAKPNQLGDLHERMRYVMVIAEARKLYETDNELWQGLCDLQLEVSFHEAANPPYGRRGVTLTAS